MEVFAMEQCEGPGESGERCPKDADRAGLCRGHRKQKAQRPEAPLIPLRPYGRSRSEAFLDAVHAYVEADSENDSKFSNARKNLFKMAAQLRRELRGAAYRRNAKVPAEADAPVCA